MNWRNLSVIVIGVIVFTIAIVDAEDYYDNLANACKKKESASCCLASVRAMRGGKYLLASENVCPDGYQPNMMRCIDSYKWCQPIYAGFPPIHIKTYGDMKPLDSNLILYVQETFEKDKVGPILSLVLVTDKEYPSGCYTLAGGSKIIGDKIFVILKGISISQKPCTQALQSPSLIVDLPDDFKNYTLLVKYQNSVDIYNILVDKNKITLTAKPNSKFTSLAKEEFLRIPSNSLWVNIGYTNRDKFALQKKEFIDGLVSLGAKEFVPKTGNYAFGGFWGLTALDNGYAEDGRQYLSGHYADDFLYFTFNGDSSAIKDLIRKFKEYECESGKADCMSIAIWTWRGEEVFSWLTK